MKSVAYLHLCFAAALTVAGCGQQDDTSKEGNGTAAVERQASAQAERQAALPACPFNQTGDWHASVENGRILVNGRVDLMMAGFKPALTPREQAGAGAIGFDLSLQQEQGAVVNERPRFEGPVSGRYGKAEIYCGDALIQTIDIVHIG